MATAASTTDNPPNISVTVPSSPEELPSPVTKEESPRIPKDNGRNEGRGGRRGSGDGCGLNWTSPSGLEDSPNSKSQSRESTGDGDKGSPGHPLSLDTTLKSVDSLGTLTSQCSIGDGDTSSLTSGASSPEATSCSSGKVEAKLGKIEVIRASTEEELVAKMEEQNRYSTLHEMKIILIIAFSFAYSCLTLSVPPLSSLILCISCCTGLKLHVHSIKKPLHVHCIVDSISFITKKNPLTPPPCFANLCILQSRFISSTQKMKCRYPYPYRKHCTTTCTLYSKKQKELMPTECKC